MSTRLLIGINGRLTLVTPTRFSSAVAHPSSDVKKESGEPGFFQKISHRWNGIPLKGETHPPRSLFDDCDKEFAAPELLPPVRKDYKEFPERDLVNFPYPLRHSYPPKTRMFMIPDSWCRPFEKVTGTSGSYLFYWGVGLFATAKEIFVFDENAMKLCGFVGLYFCISRIWQYRLDKFLYETLTNKVNEYQAIINDDLKDATTFRKESAAEAESLKAMQENFPTIFKENLQLQLEAVYRKNVETVTSELKRRIDYLQEVEATKLRFERDLLLKLITDGVQNQIASNEGNIKDQYLNSSIQQLKSLTV